MIVDHVQRVVQRIDRQFGWPTKMNFLDIQCAFAGYRFPMRFVHVIANHSGDDAVPVDHSDVRTVSEI